MAHTMIRKTVQNLLKENKDFRGEINNSVRSLLQTSQQHFSSSEMEIKGGKVSQEEVRAIFSLVIHIHT
jgi:hypothetical protein